MRSQRNPKSIEELREDAHLAHKAWKATLGRLNPRSPTNPNGMEIFLANMQRAKDKAEAKEELKTLMAEWRKKWSHVLSKNKPSDKRSRRKREILMKASRNPSDKALLGQINHIHHGPCHCYWCGVLMPNGGTVDHITPLAKGGTHTSGNICAACPECNSKKSDHSPEVAGMTGTLL